MLDVVSPVAVTMSDSGAGVALGDRQAVVEAAVDLQLGDRADADADADSGNRSRFPSSPDAGYSTSRP